jgi:hypothetical protein
MKHSKAHAGIPPPLKRLPWLIGAALAFPIMVFAIYNLAPVFGVVGLR